MAPSAKETDAYIRRILENVHLYTPQILDVDTTKIRLQEKRIAKKIQRTLHTRFKQMPDIFYTKDSWRSLGGGIAAGGYDPKTKKTYIPQNLPKRHAGPFLTHELIHALQDQRNPNLREYRRRLEDLGKKQEQKTNEIITLREGREIKRVANAIKPHVPPNASAQDIAEYVVRNHPATMPLGLGFNDKHRLTFVSGLIDEVTAIGKLGPEEIKKSVVGILNAAEPVISSYEKHPIRIPKEYSIGYFAGKYENETFTEGFAKWATYQVTKTDRARTGYFLRLMDKIRDGKKLTKGDRNKLKIMPSYIVGFEIFDKIAKAEGTQKATEYGLKGSFITKDIESRYHSACKKLGIIPVDEALKSYKHRI